MDGPTFIHGPQALANMYISRHQNPPAFSQHFPVWKLAPFRDPPQLVSVNTLGSHFCSLLWEWEGRGLCEGEKERERGRLPNGKLIWSFLTFTEPLSTSRELSFFFYKGPCSPQRPAAILRGFPHPPTHTPTPEAPPGSLGAGQHRDEKGHSISGNGFALSHFSHGCNVSKPNLGPPCLSQVCSFHTLQLSQEETMASLLLLCRPSPQSSYSDLYTL